ncbi:4'-phosphopantetheinyl transferase family protein [Natroniella sp. ANB-PHB2]|uniref:4'-phosphopantetheinyl transferase family protein n=1 Tax=Natroniella sp. ANB-PHB2 TaxID=3384444 RepID=UPI0038D470BE
MLEIYALKLDEIENFSLNDLLSYISKRRKKEVKKFLKKEDCYRSIMGEILIRKIACKKLKIKNRQIFFRKNSYGKPFLKDHNDFYFNLSHSGEWVVCAINENEVGIDIQKIEAIDLNLVNNFFSKREYESLIKQEDRQSYFYKLWTLKESYIKAIGKGLSKPLDDFTILFDGTNHIALEDRSENNSYNFSQYQLDSKNYKMSVCVRGRLKEDKLVILSISDLINGF